MLWRTEHPRMNLRRRESYLYTAAASAEMAETVMESKNNSAETETVPEKMKYHSLSQISLL